VTKKRDVAPDVQRARHLAYKLNAVAEALEQAEALDASDPLEVGPRTQYDDWRIKWIRRLTKADMGLSHPNPSTEDRRLSEHFFGLLAHMGGALVGTAKMGHEINAAEFADMALGIFIQDAPEFDARLQSLKPDAVAYIQTFRTPGGRGRAALRAKLCKALGWSDSSNAKRQARYRAKHAKRYRP
jgi:hypothetical protein